MAEEQFVLKVNGETHKVMSDPDEPLVWVLRDKLNLTGTKWGCGEGACGVCTVIIDDEATRSCMLPVSSVSSGEEIITIEGLAKNGELTPLQQAFIDHMAFQCGFCTPGMIMTATALLKSNPDPTREEIIAAMDDNLCRCAGYLNIIEAIESVVAREET